LRDVPLTFTGSLDHQAVTAAVGQLTTLVGSREVADVWDRESALPGMTVGGLTRHLVSQPESAVEFLISPAPAGAEVVTLTSYVDRVDWLLAPVDAPENTSIRDEFNDRGKAGQPDSVEVLARSLQELPAALATAGPTTYVPWQDCALPTDDFLVVRLLEVVVHADDLAVSVGVATPAFEPAVLDPVVALLSVLAARRRGQDAVVRALSRHERSGGSVSAF
jgi:hypothetical protein